MVRTFVGFVGTPLARKTLSFIKVMLKNVLGGTHQNLQKYYFTENTAKICARGVPTKPTKVFSVHAVQRSIENCSA